jgi:hypothetical protein
VCLWIFEGQLFAVEELDGCTPPSKMKFDIAAFWIRMYNLLLVCMERKMGFKLDSIVGKVEEVVIDMDGIGWGEYLRVRVHVNLKKPIPRGRILKLKDQSLWILFQHEKLPKFCFSCGIISHGPGGCIVRDGRAKLGEALGGEYGPWLRVTSNRPWVEKQRGRLGKEMSILVWERAT